MVANPLNATYCVGSGLGVDTFGRPTWQRTLAGQWTAASIYRAGMSGTGRVVVSKLIAHIENTTNHTRDLLITGWSPVAGILDHGLAWPEWGWSWNVAPNTVDAVQIVAAAVTQGIVSTNAMRATGPRTITFTTVAAGASTNAVLLLWTNATRDGPGFVYQYDIGDFGMFIEAHWLGN